MRGEGNLKIMKEPGMMTCATTQAAKKVKANGVWRDGQVLNWQNLVSYMAREGTGSLCSEEWKP